MDQHADGCGNPNGLVGVARVVALTGSPQKPELPLQLFSEIDFHSISTCYQTYRAVCFDHHHGKSGSIILSNREYLTSPGARNACLNENRLSSKASVSESIISSSPPMSDR